MRSTRLQVIAPARLSCCLVILASDEHLKASAKKLKDMQAKIPTARGRWNMNLYFMKLDYYDNKIYIYMTTLKLASNKRVRLRRMMRWTPELLSTRLLRRQRLQLGRPRSKQKKRWQE